MGNFQPTAADPLLLDDDDGDEDDDVGGAEADALLSGGENDRPLVASSLGPEYRRATFPLIFECYETMCETYGRTAFTLNLEEFDQVFSLAFDDTDEHFALWKVEDPAECGRGGKEAVANVFQVFCALVLLCEEPMRGLDAKVSALVRLFDFDESETLNRVEVECLMHSCVEGLSRATGTARPCSKTALRSVVDVLFDESPTVLPRASKVLLQTQGELPRLTASKDDPSAPEVTLAQFKKWASGNVAIDAYLLRFAGAHFVAHYQRKVEEAFAVVTREFADHAVKIPAVEEHNNPNINPNISKTIPPQITLETLEGIMRASPEKQRAFDQRRAARKKKKKTTATTKTETKKRLAASSAVPEHEDEGDVKVDAWGSPATDEEIRAFVRRCEAAGGDMSGDENAAFLEDGGAPTKGGETPTTAAKTTMTTTTTTPGGTAGGASSSSSASSSSASAAPPDDAVSKSLIDFDDFSSLLLPWIAFSVVDGRSAGALSSGELKVLIWISDGEQNPEPSKSVIEHAERAIDVNHDGLVSRTEWLEYNSRFDPVTGARRFLKAPEQLFTAAASPSENNGTTNHKNNNAINNNNNNNNNNSAGGTSGGGDGPGGRIVDPAGNTNNQAGTAPGGAQQQQAPNQPPATNRILTSEIREIFVSDLKHMVGNLESDAKEDAPAVRFSDHSRSLLDDIISTAAAEVGDLVDVNHDGFISWDEFARNRKRVATKQEKIRQYAKVLLRNDHQYDATDDIRRLEPPKKPKHTSKLVHLGTTPAPPNPQQRAAASSSSSSSSGSKILILPPKSTNRAAPQRAATTTAIARGTTGLPVIESAAANALPPSPRPDQLSALAPSRGILSLPTATKGSASGPNTQALPPPSPRVPGAS